MSVHAPIATLVILLLGFIQLTSAQSFVRETMDFADHLHDIKKLDKDAWNRLVVATNKGILAFDGKQTYPILENPYFILRDVHVLPKKELNVFLGKNQLFITKPKWHANDSIISTLKFNKEVIAHAFELGYLVVQFLDNTVSFVNLDDLAIHEVPFAGGRLSGITFNQSLIYLYEEHLLTYNIKSKRLRESTIQLPPGKNFITQNSGVSYVVTANGQIWAIDIIKMESSFIGRTGLSSDIIGVEYVDQKLYIFSEHDGVILYAPPNGNISYVHEGNGLCSEKIMAYYIDNSTSFWTTNGEAVCLTKDKYPILADKELGLRDERLHSIASIDDKIFFSNKSVGLYNFEKGVINKLDTRAGFVESPVTAMASTASGILIAALGSGLIEWQHEDGFNYSDSSLFQNDEVTSIITKIDGPNYIGTAESGLYGLYRDSTSQKHAERLFPSRIKQVVDLIGIFNGDFYIATRKAVWQYTKDTDRLERIYVGSNEMSTDEKSEIRDLALWNGVLYVLYDYGLSCLPIAGSTSTVSHFDHSNGLSRDKLLSINVAKNVVFISDEKGTTLYDHEFFLKYKNGKKPELGVTFRIAKNGIIQHGDELIMATNHGLRIWDRNNTLKKNKIIFQHALVNNTVYSDVEGSRFKGSENRWRIRVATISPEYAGDLQFSWNLKGSRHSFSGTMEGEEIFIPFLPPDNYNMEIVATAPGYQTAALQRKFSIQPRFYQTENFILYSLVGALIAMTLFAYAFSSFSSRKLRKRNANLKWENEKLEWQQKALQLQMNPHFIFNALNSIQGLVGKDDKNARYYISKLGKLMRTTLNHSREKWITIEDEIDFIATYLELEKLNNEFTYSIDKGNVSKNNLIPPMMIQPLVENAVKHGVSQMNEGGIIDIVFLYEGRKIKCRITDNGPGLKHNDKAGNYASVSSKVINERMDIYRKEGIKVDPIRISNVKTDGGKKTEVTIGLPYQEKEEI